MSWGPEAIGREIEAELRRFGPAAGMAEILAVWASAVGDQIARNAWPARIARDGTLHINASSSAWAFELGQLEATILSRLRTALPAVPPRLRFAVGALPETTSEGTTPPPKSAPDPGAAERAEAERLASAIEDEELRALVERAAAASLAKTA